MKALWSSRLLAALVVVALGIAAPAAGSAHCVSRHHKGCWVKKKKAKTVAKRPPAAKRPSTKRVSVPVAPSPAPAVFAPVQPPVFEPVPAADAPVVQPTADQPQRSDPSLPHAMQVIALDTDRFGFSLSRSLVYGPLTIYALNQGQDPHDFSIRAPDGHETSLGELQSRDQTSATLDLAPGRYTLFCALPGHEAAGMRAAFTVG